MNIPATAPVGEASTEKKRLLHTMIRVRDLRASIDFYVGRLGMRQLRRQNFEEGRFTLVFLGYDEEDRSSVIELTYNWDDRAYTLGDAFGHMAIAVPDVFRAIEELRAEGVRIVREAGPLQGDPRQMIAFVEDPDGYRIELIRWAA